MHINVILVLAMLFIIYEAYKIVFMKRQMTVLGDLEQMTNTKNAMEKRALVRKLSGSFLYKGTLALEFSYIIFCIVLIFTKVWYIGLLVLLLVFLKGPMDKMGTSKKGIWVADCVLSIALLAIVVKNYL